MELDIVRGRRAHIVDDPSALSERARVFLAQVAHRDDRADHRRTECMKVKEANGDTVRAPNELITHREGFAQTFGGMRYHVRSVVFMPDGPRLHKRQWRFDLGDDLRPDRCGWYFDWYGEHVSSPVSYVQHTDGRSGVSDSCSFIPVYPTMLCLIESHALLDMCADWEPHPHLSEDAAGRIISELTPIPEASGPWAGWYADEDIAIHHYQMWTSDTPRPKRSQVWTATPEGRRRFEAAAKTTNQ